MTFLFFTEQSHYKQFAFPISNTVTGKYPENALIFFRFLLNSQIVTAS